MIRNERGEGEVGLVLILAMAIVIVGALGMWGCPTYNVWQQRLAGKAEFERATMNRKIAVEEAIAKKESAVALAAAEIERSKGVAEANRIIGASLKGNDDYLRYLWISELSGGEKSPTVIYVPTEAGLPILEAGRRP